MNGAYPDPNDDLNPWILLNLHWLNTRVKAVIDFDGALPSYDTGWIDEIEQVPREGLFKKTYIGSGSQV